MFHATGHSLHYDLSAPPPASQVERASDELFGRVDDAIREASLMATGRTLSPERLAETAQAGLKEIFGQEKRE